LAVFEASGFKRTLCGSTWESLKGDKNAFTSLGSSTARYGCCPSSKYMSAPSNEWRAQPIGYAPTDDTGSFLHRTHIDISKLPGGASCRTYCSKDVNLQGYSIRIYKAGTSDCWCYTTKYDISMYDSFKEKYSGSKKKCLMEKKKRLRRTDRTKTMK